MNGRFYCTKCAPGTNMCEHNWFDMEPIHVGGGRLVGIIKLVNYVPKTYAYDLRTMPSEPKYTVSPWLNFNIEYNK